MLRQTIFLLIVLALFSCKEDAKTPPESNEPKPEKKAVTIPSFDRDSAFVFVEKQTLFGPRVPNSEAHRNARKWMVEQLKGFGAEVIEQNFDATAYTGEVLKSTNIIAQFNPEKTKRVVLAAHWDSRHIADHDPLESNQTQHVMGADDGASGVGVLMEIARQIQANPIDLGVDIVLFDAEDYGDGGNNGDYKTWCLGSQYWSRNPHKTGYKAKYGILLDMVGAKGARFTKERVSMNYAPKVMNKVWKLAQDMGYGNFFVNDPTRELIDDHLFVNQIAGIPMIDIINRPNDTETLFVQHWHTINDTIDKIDKRTLRAVGQVLLAVIYRESGNNF